MNERWSKGDTVWMQGQQRGWLYAEVDGVVKLWDADIPTWRQCSVVSDGRITADGRESTRGRSVRLQWPGGVEFDKPIEGLDRNGRMPMDDQYSRHTTYLNQNSVRVAAQSRGLLLETYFDALLDYWINLVEELGFEPKDRFGSSSSVGDRWSKAAGQVGPVNTTNLLEVLHTLDYFSSDTRDWLAPVGQTQELRAMKGYCEAVNPLVVYQWDGLVDDETISPVVYSTTMRYQHGYGSMLSLPACDMSQLDGVRSVPGSPYVSSS